jgi:hypothetical protein
VVVGEGGFEKLGNVSDVECRPGAAGPIQKYP